jgi:hypothetical protein
MYNHNIMSKKRKQASPKPADTPVPFTRAHSKPHRLEEHSRARRKREERDAKNGKWGQD